MVTTTHDSWMAAEPQPDLEGGLAQPTIDVGHVDGPLVDRGPVGRRIGGARVG